MDELGKIGSLEGFALRACLYNAADITGGGWKK
jgi:hypothetical protein